MLVYVYLVLVTWYARDSPEEFRPDFIDLGRLRRVDFIFYYYLWLHWVFVSVLKLSLVAAGRDCLLTAVTSLVEHGL